ncbi:MAG: fatty acid desaturase [Pseudomonadota bacterium]
MARALLGPIVFYAPMVTGFYEGYQLLTMAFIYYLIGNSNYVLHLHIHHPFTTSRALNRVIDLSLASITAMTASNWRIQHLQNHHLGKELLFNGSKDWEVETYSPLRALSYCLRSMWWTFWRPMKISFQKGVAGVTKPIDYRWAAAEHVILLIFVAFLFWLNPYVMATHVIPLYVLTYFITRYVDYLNHYGCDEEHENALARANNSLHARFNRRTHNFGYHTAHHLNPGAHWTKLPEIHARIEGDIPVELKKDVSWSWMLLPYHMLLSRTGRM